MTSSGTHSATLSGTSSDTHPGTPSVTPSATPKVAATLIRLRWALTFASLRHSPQRIIAAVVSLVFAVCLVAAAAIVSLRFGGDAMPASTRAGDLLNTSVVLGGAVAMLGVLLFHSPSACLVTMPMQQRKIKH